MEVKQKCTAELAKKLIRQGCLEKEEYIELLSCYQEQETADILKEEAGKLRSKYYGNKVYMRGLIEL